MNKTLNIDDVIHPEDKSALENLKSVPGFDVALKAWMKHWDEQMQHGLNMANNLRLSPTQFPDLYNILPPLCAKLGIKEPEFYLHLQPLPNAWTGGDSRVYVVATSGLLQSCDTEELTAVLAHECGHIACRHVMYHALAGSLLKWGSNLIPLPGIALLPLQLALVRWSRMSELSADRVGALLAGNPETVVKMTIRFSGLSKDLAQKINMREYLKQAEAYDKLQANGGWDQLLQTYAVLGADHPFNAIRAREIMKWGKTESFKNLAKSIGTYAPICEKCGAKIESPWRFCQMCGRPA